MRVQLANTTCTEIIVMGQRMVGPNEVYWSEAVAKAERTPWFQWPTRPVNVGWYETRGRSLDSGTPMFWNGQQWGYWMQHPASETNLWVHWADDDTDEWRGLTRKL